MDRINPASLIECRYRNGTLTLSEAVIDLLFIDVVVPATSDVLGGEVDEPDYELVTEYGTIRTRSINYALRQSVRFGVPIMATYLGCVVGMTPQQATMAREVALDSLAEL